MVEEETDPTVISVSQGSMWEGATWELRRDVLMSGRDEDSACPCPHCRDYQLAPPQYRTDGTVWNLGTMQWVCPLVIVGYNEGGYCTTGICAACAVDAVQKAAPPG